jgi:tyrosine aminotransferase
MPPNVLKTELLYSSSSSLNENALPTDLEGVWFCPASEKSLRTINPIRAIVDPIVSKSIKSGAERGDGKDQISLAVSFYSIILFH